MNLNIFQWRSLKTRVTLSTLTFFLIGVWVLAFYSSYILRKDLEHSLSEQQFSTVSLLAEGINDEIETRMKALEEVAARITPAMLGNTVVMQKYLEDRLVLKTMFNGGCWVARHDGTVIADIPTSSGRMGANYGDRDWMIEIFKGKSVVGTPIMGKQLKAPLIPIAAPIRDTKGNVLGVLAGTTDLSKPSFISKYTDKSYGKTGGYLVFSRQQRTMVYATDKKLIMATLSGLKINPLIERFIQGYEGSGVTVNPLGVEVLSSAKGIAVAGWYMIATIPTKEAFAPVRAMQNRSCWQRSS